MSQPSSTVDILINDLRTEVARRRLTKRSLAKLASLHPNTLARFGKPDWAPSIYTLRALEGALLKKTVQQARAA